MLALAVAGFRSDDGRPANLFFYIFAATGLGAALRVITHPRPVYAALYFILTILSTAGLFLLLHAEFLTFAIIIIYAGAILITYLFVIMLATQTAVEGAPDTVSAYDVSAREPIAATVVGFGLLAALTGMLATGVPALPAAPVVGASPDAVLAALPKKVERSFEQAGLTEGALPLRPGRLDAWTPEGPAVSVYSPEARAARMRYTDIGAARERWTAARAVMAGEAPAAGVEPFSPEAMALIAPPHDRIGPTPIPGTTLAEMRVRFPDDLRADNLEAVGFAMLAEHPPGVPDGAMVATLDTTPEGYVDLDPALVVLRDAGIVTSRIGRNPL